MDDEAIRSVVTRLARSHSSGGEVIERAAILAEGGDFPAVMAWITAHGGKPEAMVSTPPGAASMARASTTAAVPRTGLLAASCCHPAR